MSEEKIMNVNNLLTVSNYARKINQSVTNVYRLIEQNTVNSQIIDGVKFVVLDWKSNKLIK